MSENKTTSYSTGIGSPGLLPIVFITLKLCHVIDWRWLWVLAPVWIPLVLALGGPLLVIALIAFALKS